MPRRIALALALACTTIVTFAIVVVGWNGGIFGGGASEAEADPSAEEVAGALQYLAAISAPAPEIPPTAAQPVSPRVQTEYVYVYEDVPAAAAPAQRAAAPSGATTAPATAAPSDEEQVLAPSATPRATRTPAPAATATAPPAVSEPQESELEFTGTVTAIDGDQVTWTYRGGTVTTRVVDNLNELSVGTTAKVHAIRVSSGYVAKEIELDDD